MSKYDRMRPAVRPANWMKPRSTHSVSATTALLSAVLTSVDHWAPMSMYDRKVPYSVCVRRSTLTPVRTRKPKLDVSVRVSRPAMALLPPPPMPFGTSLPVLLNDVCTRTNEPIFKQVSVPGTYQKPAPYRLQTFTYSTGLVFTGRSAACAPLAATRTAALPRRNLRICPTPRFYRVAPISHVCRRTARRCPPHVASKSVFRAGFQPLSVDSCWV